MLNCNNTSMQERDYPKFVSFPHHSVELYELPLAPAVHPPQTWVNRLNELDESVAIDIQQAIQDAADMHTDVHLYRKIGSRFLGIGFEYSDGTRVKVWEHPDIAA